MNDACLLIGDIGGTNARFALADPHAPGFSMQKDFACADFATAGLAMRAYLDEISSPQPDVICIAAAGPVIGETVRFTNKNWAIDANEIKGGRATLFRSSRADRRRPCNIIEHA